MGFITGTAKFRNFHYNAIIDTCQYLFDNVNHFSYKDHVKADADSKIITDYAVTGVNEPNNQEFVGFLNSTDDTIYEDSANAGKGTGIAS